MEAAKFTKGEWFINYMPLPSRKTVEIKSSYGAVCELKHNEREKHYTLEGLPTMEANAKLISNAPRLLYELENAIVSIKKLLSISNLSIEHKHIYEIEIDKHERAIKKATS